MRPKFDKSPSGLIPAVVQDGRTGRVLSAGFMSKKAYKKTVKSGVVNLFTQNNKKQSSETDNGYETLNVLDVLVERGGMALLIKTQTSSSVKETSLLTDFGEQNTRYGYLPELERFIRKKINKPVKSSRTTRLVNRGVAQIAKKIGEEAVELVIEVLNDDDELLKSEVSDLLYHLMVLLAAKDIPLDEVIEVLRKRRK